MSKPESYASVWDAIADTPEQAANLRARAELMQKIAARLRQHDWTQDEAARRCGVTQPRINDLLRGRVSRFSLGPLGKNATGLGGGVRGVFASLGGFCPRRQAPLEERKFARRIDGELNRFAVRKSFSASSFVRAIARLRW